ncbi:MAG TPA: DUF6266 family protein [Puia sp.]|nr:DUF6266 family protein [Puia sp.]
MAYLPAGILGPVSGRLGNLVFMIRDGKTYARIRSRRKVAASTEKQAAQQRKFSLMMRFLQPLTPLLKQLPRSSCPRMTTFNHLFSWNVRQAITGSFPEFRIDYSKVLLSRGILPSAETMAASPAPGKISLMWKDNSGGGMAKSSDRVFVAAYCEALDQWVWSLENTTRSAGLCSLDAAAVSGHSAQVYIGFLAAAGKPVSGSSYIGEVSLR